MYPRVNYEMTQEDLDTILNSMKSVPMIMLNIGGSRSPQERANDAWEQLGKKMGFDSMTVQPIFGKGDRFFSAVPLENETQKKTRLLDEAIKQNNLALVAKQNEIEKLTREIMEINNKIATLQDNETAA
jgi:nitrogen regulatory protein PII